MYFCGTHIGVCLGVVKVHLELQSRFYELARPSFMLLRSNLISRLIWDMCDFEPRTIIGQYLSQLVNIVPCCHHMHSSEVIHYLEL